MLKKILLALIVASAVMHGQNWHVNLSSDTSGNIKHGQDLLVNFNPGYFLPGWSGGNLSKLDMDKLKAGEMFVRTAANNQDVNLTSALQAEQLNSQTVLLSYTLTALKEAKMQSFYVGFRFPFKNLLGHTYKVDDGDATPFPETYKTDQLFRKPVKSFVLTSAFGTVSLTFRKPTVILLQDNRQWSNEMVIRVSPADEIATTWVAGRTEHFDLEIAFTESATLNKPALTQLVANDDWIPLNTVLGIKPGSALDFSQMGFTDAPAGKHGWIKAVGKHFEFERLPGVNQRFYGINFVGTGQIVPHDQGVELAERLWRLGYNTVRFHHHENSLVLHEKTCSTNLNPASMDKFDFFYNELKKRGIYCTTDMYVSRVVLRTELWPGEAGRVEMNEFKHLLPVCKEAMDNWKAFSRNFLTHKNPYTGMTYAEDPCMAWISMVNEGTPNAGIVNGDDKVAQLWREKWHGWLLKKYADEARIAQAWGVKAPVDLKTTKRSDAAMRDLADFIEAMQVNMFEEMKRFIRDELGCRALLTDMNYSTISPWAQNVRTHYDYVDHHFYIDHPAFLDKPWRLPSKCPNNSVVRGGTIGGISNSFARLFDKPFTLSEYNYSGPGRYRGVGGILTGCLGTLQDWACIWRFAYSHNYEALFNPSVTNYFDMCRDPLNQCAERATLLLYLRQDMKPSKHTIAVTLDKEHSARHPGAPEGWIVPNWCNLAALAQVGTVVDNLNGLKPDICVPLSERAPAAGHVIRHEKPLTNAANSLVIDAIKSQKWLPDGNLTDFNVSPYVRQTPDKQFTLIPQQDTMILDTPLTAGGFAPADTTIQTSSLSIKILDTDATVWASSLDGKPIAESRHLLLTHLTDLGNTNMQFAEAERRTLLSWGILPHVVRNGRAEVRFKHANAKINVWNLRVNGERLQPLPVEKTADGFAVNLGVKGPDGAQMLYEIVCE